MPPYTKGDASTSIMDCRRCPEGQYFDGSRGVCSACIQPCIRNDEYETQSCSDEHDRICSPCDMALCDPVFEYVLDEEGCSISSGPRACATCTEKPPNSIFVAGNYPWTCSWQCNDGYFSSIGDRSTASCQTCTAWDAVTCPAGRIFRSCSEFLHSDSSCDDECDAVSFGKKIFSMHMLVFFP